MLVVECRYRLMHPDFPTWSSATETQSSPPSPSPPGTTSAVTTYASSKLIALACDIANPFPPDLWGYVHGFSYWLIYELVMYGKSLSAGPCEVSCIDLAIIVTFFTCRCWSTTTKKGRMYEMYKMYETYEEVWDRWKVSESVRFSGARSRHVAGDLSPWRRAGEPAGSEHA